MNMAKMVFSSFFYFFLGGGGGVGALVANPFFAGVGLRGGLRAEPSQV